MRKNVLKGWRPLLVLILFFVVWELTVKYFRIETWLLPAPTAILEEASTSLPDFWPHMLATIQLSAAGFAAGCVVGILVAVTLHMLPRVREAFYPLLILSQNIPIIVLAPLLVIWFGFGMLPKLIVITLVCFFPVAVALLDGFRQTPRELYHYMRMAGATKSQLFFKLEWPNSLPSLFSGLKISATYSVMGAVISEWLGAQEGIGVYMTLASSSFQTSRVFVAILAVMVLSLGFFLIIWLLQRVIIKWQVDKEDGR
ncbi:MAG TPA: ABC transporter permease [Chondromyces sp.]|nr:ABC transporter permease [Chondromyces sp.]